MSDPGAYTLALDAELFALAAHLRAGRIERAVFEAERLARDTRQPGLRALLTDVAAALAPGAPAKRDGEA